VVGSISMPPFRRRSEYREGNDNGATGVAKSGGLGLGSPVGMSATVGKREIGKMWSNPHGRGRG
jgi:hypothetical protein